MNTIPIYLKLIATDTKCSEWLILVYIVSVIVKQCFDNYFITFIKNFMLIVLNLHASYL